MWSLIMKSCKGRDYGRMINGERLMVEGEREEGAVSIVRDEKGAKPLRYYRVLKKPNH